MPLIRVAAAQIDVVFADVKANLAVVLGTLEDAAKQGAKLVVFPECALSGYCFTSAEEARAAASDASRIVYVPGEYEIDRVGHRRPELYGPLTE